MQLLQGVLMMILLVGLSSNAQVQGECGPTSGLLACLPAAEADVQPSGQCCTVLQRYLTTGTPEACLCQAATSTAFESSGADVQYAIRIPQKCNLSYRAGTQCNGTLQNICNSIKISLAPHFNLQLLVQSCLLNMAPWVIWDTYFCVSSFVEHESCRCYNSWRPMNIGALHRWSLQRVWVLISIRESGDVLRDEQNITNGIAWSVE